MGKEKKQGTWLVFLRSGAVALCLYLIGILILAFVMIQGFLPEGASFAALACAGFVSALAGGMAAVRQSPWATLPTAMLNAAMMVLFVLAIGSSAWPETFWNEQSIMLVLSILAGGFASGVLGARKRTGKRRRSRAGAR